MYLSFINTLNITDDDQMKCKRKQAVTLLEYLILSPCTVVQCRYKRVWSMVFMRLSNIINITTSVVYIYMQQRHKY